MTVSATVSGDEPAMQWRVTVEGEKCRFLVFGHLVLGEQEFAHARSRSRSTHSESDSPSGRTPRISGARNILEAAYHLVTSTPGRIEAIGGDELLYARRETPQRRIRRRSGPRPMNEFAFAVVGSMTDAQAGERIGGEIRRGPSMKLAMLKPGDRFWRNLTRGVRVKSAKNSADALAVDTIFPWLAHDAHDPSHCAARSRTIYRRRLGLARCLPGPGRIASDARARSSRSKKFCASSSPSNTRRAATGRSGSCSSPIRRFRSKESHGDIIVWPLKALCDYIEATGDFAFLDETIAWRREDNFDKTAHADPVTAHVDKLIETVRARFIPGTNLIRYGNGDWNDSLQPVDPTKRDWMTSAWTVVLLYEQLRRYAEILRHAKRAPKRAKELDALAAAIRKDFNTHPHPRRGRRRLWRVQTGRRRASAFAASWRQAKPGSPSRSCR